MLVPNRLAGIPKNTLDPVPSAVFKARAAGWRGSEPMTDLVVLGERKRYSSCERHKLNLRGGYVQKLRFLIHESAALSRRMLYHLLTVRYQSQPSANLQLNGACFEFGPVAATLVDQHERWRRAHHKCAVCQ